MLLSCQSDGRGRFGMATRAEEKRKVTVLLRVKVDGKWKRLPATFGRNGRIRPEFAQVGEEQIEYPEAAYELCLYEHRQARYVPAGRNASDADAKRRIEEARPSERAVKKDASAAGLSVCRPDHARGHTPVPQGAATAYQLADLLGVCATSIYAMVKRGPSPTSGSETTSGSTPWSSPPGSGSGRSVATTARWQPEVVGHGRDRMQPDSTGCVRPGYVGGRYHRPAVPILSSLLQKALRTSRDSAIGDRMRHIHPRDAGLTTSTWGEPLFRRRSGCIAS